MWKYLILLLIIIVPVATEAQAEQNSTDMMAPFTPIKNQNGTVTILFNSTEIALFTNMQDAIEVVNRP